jgi:hypothetical protein
MPGRTVKHAVIAAFFTLLAASTSGAQTIQVVGLDGRASAIDTKGLERRSVVTQDRGLKTTFEGVALRDVLAKAGVPFGDALKGGAALTRVVIARASDGYTVAYAIAELDAAFTDQIVLLADRRNGNPLVADTGPWQIVVPNDKRAARWIRQVTRLEVRQLP